MFACVICWFLVAANFACRLYKPRYSEAFTMVCAILACSITLFVYSSVFRVARKRRFLRRSEKVIGDFAQNSNRDRMNFIQNWNVAKMYFLVVILSFKCFAPNGAVVFAIKYPWRESESRRSLITQVLCGTTPSTP